MTRAISRVHVGARRGVVSGELPVITHTAPAAGPLVVITANLHGDEITGTHAVFALDRLLGHQLTAGTVVLYPTTNPGGLAAGTRVSPPDDVDLNRQFPGSARGTWSSRLAAALWRDLSARDPALLIDLHSDAPAAIPYAIIDRPARLPAAQREALAGPLLAVADATGFTVIREYADEAYLQYQLDRSLAGAAVNLLGIPALTLEVGPRRGVDEHAVATMVQGVRNVLMSRKMVEGQPLISATRVPGIWRRSVTPRVRKAGMCRPVMPPGQVFVRGEVLAQVRNLYGDLEEDVVATEPGVVLSWVECGWVAVGAVTGTIAVADAVAL